MELVVNVDTYYKPDTKLGVSLHAIALLNAPIRTGNLRKSIYLLNNTQTTKKYYYDAYNAYYLDFLENGQGRNKKHKGFISVNTLNAMTKELVSYFKTGKVEYPFLPSHTFNVSNDKPRNYERAYLRDIGFNLNRRINASERAYLSRLEYSNRLGKDNPLFVDRDTDVTYKNMRQLKYIRSLNSPYKNTRDGMFSSDISDKYK